MSVLKLDYFDKQTLELSFTDNKKFSTFLHCGLPSNHWENNAYTTVRLYRRKPCSLWDALWDVPHGVSHPPSRYGGRGRRGRPESGHFLRIFENAQEPCNIDVHFRRQYNLFPTERGTGAVCISSGYFPKSRFSSSHRLSGKNRHAWSVFRTIRSA